MAPTGNRLLRPILALVTLCLAAFLLAPTVASVHARINDLHFDRATPWEIFKWTDEPSPGRPFPDCGSKNRHLYSEITQWPARIEKDEAFTLRGVVQSEEDDRAGVPQAKVDVFLNETKEEPGIFLGEGVTGPGGFFTLMALVPFELKAQRYHIVAHAKQMRIDCSTYYEHWSDPETEVVSNTNITFLPVENAIAGREFFLTGTLLDSVGAPLRRENVTITWDRRPQLVTTDDDGVFTFNHTPKKAGNATFTAKFRGSDFYMTSTNETTVEVMPEEFVIEGASENLAFLRSEAKTLTGHVYVEPGKEKEDFLLTFHGANFTTCTECPPGTTVRVPLGENGTFTIPLLAPSNETGARGTFVASGGGLQEEYTFNFTLTIPTTMELKVDGAGLFSKRFHAVARVLDEVGRPLNTTIAFEGPAGWDNNATDAKGIARFTGSASCGNYPTRAVYNGSGNIGASNEQSPVLVCGWLAFIPLWLLAIPWYAWPLAIGAIWAAIYLWRTFRQTYATTILSGPRLALRFTSPADDALGFADIGESVVATAFLEEPLPDGHALRMGVSRKTEERPLDGALRAHLRLRPDKLGEISVRAEIVDPKGRVVTRRTASLHVVRYAHEIERRYLALRAHSGARESVTPREFEGWLRERAPSLDAAIARRLILVFEEADYSPRVAGRADFAAYLAAEKLHMESQEVPPRAELA